MKKMKLTAAILALSVLTSCSQGVGTSGNSDSSGKTGVNSGQAGNVELTAALVDNAIYWSDSPQLVTDKFNKSKNEITVDLKIYENDVDDYLSDSSFTALGLDMASGNIPDVVIAPPDKMDKLRRQGYLADLYPIMESADGIKKDDLLDNVTDCLESDGKMELIFSSFTLETAAAKASVAGVCESWSFDEMESVFSAHPQSEEYDFLYHQTDDGMFSDFLTKKMLMSCINMDDHTCNFTDMVPRLFRFYNAAPKVGARYKTGNYPDNFDYMLINNHAVVNCFTITGINSFCASEICTYFGGEPIVYVGYPSMNDSGAYTTVPLMYGISASCKNKEAAWEYISEYFGKSEQKRVSENCRGIPVTKEVLNELAYDTPSYMNNSIRSKLTTVISEEDSVEITDEAIDGLVDYVSNVKLEPFVNARIEQIIREEYMSVINDESTPEECAENLNRRIGLYLSEIS